MSCEPINLNFKKSCATKYFIGAIDYSIELVLRNRAPAGATWQHCYWYSGHVMCHIIALLHTGLRVISCVLIPGCQDF